MSNDLLRKHISLYIIHLYEEVPTSLYCLVAGVSFVWIVLSFCLYDVKKASRLSVWVLLIAYVVILVSSTVLFRTVDSYQKLNVIPLSSYQAFKDGEVLIIMDIIMNVVAFIPLGFLLGFIIKKNKWKKILLVAISMSFSIEILQFLLKRGSAQFDDIINNTLGCMIGYSLCMFGVLIYKNTRVSDC